ncbi:hypothetical protein B0T26DRAFT_678491 [Lasiosphaeria miniovina]|uniref:Uncharacterized protein n=1 Tax=Lasiosphaeria miniovina TaxID=1954250 RepID=A0AA40DR62_9PEZI|nr:uncharacterized protein B0T26DRAFT_678491 [Lasiosphaeria miniovina]KAK0709008.1 hypothetical protein B0T26DRAFT_678491 [Lasiosphaeria miniovina]
MTNLQDRGTVLVYWMVRVTELLEYRIHLVSIRAVNHDVENMPAAAMVKEDDNVAWHTLRVVPVLVEPTRGLCDDLKVDLLVAAAKDFRRLRDITALERPWNYGDTWRLRLATAAKMCKCERLELEVELTVEVVKEALVIETRSRKALEEIFLRSAIVAETACFKRAQSDDKLLAAEGARQVEEAKAILENLSCRGTLLIRRPPLSYLRPSKTSLADPKRLVCLVFGMSVYVGGRRAGSIEDIRLVEGSGISALLKKTKLSEGKRDPFLDPKNPGS